MSAIKGQEKTSEEWKRLSALRSHRDRLLNKKYAKLNRAQAQAGDIATKNGLSLLEDGLRNIMRRNDLDVHFSENGLDQDAMKHAQAQLTSLCVLLEGIVNLDHLQMDSADEQLENESSYPKLDGLLSRLGNTSWKFVMVSGTGRKLFTTTSPESNRQDIDNFNNLINRLTQPDISDLQVPTEADDQSEPAELDRRLSDSIQKDPFSKALKGLNVLLTWMKELTSCRGCHDILLQLPEWDRASSRERFRKPHLELFLSTCASKQNWQQSRLTDFVSDNQDDWCPADKICAEIQDANTTDERLDLAVSGDDLLVFCGEEESDDETEDGDKYAIFQKPSKTLKQLIQEGAFHGPGVWIPGSKVARFHQNEKRDLATALVVSLALTSETDHLLKCWDPDSVYFLAGMNGECIRNMPYALCESQSKGHKGCTPSRTKSDAIDIRSMKFRLLAKLLMEIESGVVLTGIPLERGGGDTGTQTLEDVIFDEIQKDLGGQRVSYLKAVNECLKFDEKFQRKLKHMDARGKSGGTAEAVRSLVYAIVKKIQESSRVPMTNAEVDWSAISSELSRLGFSKMLPELKKSHFLSKNKTPHVTKDPKKEKTTKVRFAIDNDDEISPVLDRGDTEDNSTMVAFEAEGLINIDEAASPDEWSGKEIDEYQLFADDATQHRSEALCKAAQIWTKSFKTLRKEKKIGLGSTKRLKVAVLDTGIDISHPKIQGEKDRITEYQSFVDGDATSDTSGHGTHIAGIILDLTTNVDLQIGKVIVSSSAQNREAIVNALIHARETWQVDIITLSLGFRTTQNPDRVQEEIENCLRAGIMVFASASNDGGNKARTYPGDYADVLCIHSATGEGNKSSFNPTPEPKWTRKDNFSVVGDCMISLWPMQKTDFYGTKGKKYLSGTSIATPVAVSIAAFMIGYIKRAMADYKWNIRPWSPQGMRLIFREMSHERDGYDWISPVWYFEKYSEDGIKIRLRDMLRGWKT